jgi:heavy metal sensor kinase
MRKLTIGWRLTLWYSGILAASLVAFGGVVYVTFGRNLLGEIDRALAEELAEIAVVVRQAPDGVPLEARLESNFGRHEFYEIQVVDTAGVVRFRTPGLVGQLLPAPAVPSTDQQTANAVLTGVGEFRVASRLVAGQPGEFIIQAADSLELYRRELRGLLAVLVGTVPIILGGALAGGYWLSRRALAPVDRLTVAALDISAARLDRRVSVLNPDDELGRLARAFNGMIERLERSFDEIRRFTADAAHELRTPLAVLRNEAEVTLRADRPPEQYRQVLENQLEEIGRLTRLAEELLFLCREDAGLERAVRQPVRIDQILEQLVGQLQTAAQARELTLALDDIPACVVSSDPDRLRRLFFNLLDNALKYTLPNGTVRISGAPRRDRIEVVVSDSGVGIPAEHLPRVCERFYRVDPSRSRAIDGAGLGLAICRAIVEAHGGKLQIESAPGAGTRVTVSLPIGTMCENVVATSASTGDLLRNSGRTQTTNISGGGQAAGDAVRVILSD